jgi:Transmembrane secretion effector
MSAVLVWLDFVNPSTLLLFTFLLGAGAAFTAPALQSVVPQLVLKQELRTLVTLRAWLASECHFRAADILCQRLRRTRP